MKLHPYISFDGNAEEVLNFYTKIFNGNIEMMMRFGEAPFPTDEKDANKVMHARISFDDNVIIISDRMRKTDLPDSINVQLFLHLNDEQRLEYIFSELAQGGTVIMPLAIQFWGNKYGIVKDKFGIDWMLDCEVKK